MKNGKGLHAVPVAALMKLKNSSENVPELTQADLPASKASFLTAQLQL